MGLVSYGRISEILIEDQEQLDSSTFKPSKPLQGAVEFRNVSFEYDSNAAVLHDISFQVEPGQTIALLGAVTAAAGRMLGDIGAYGNYAVAVIFFALVTVVATVFVEKSRIKYAKPR